MKPQQEHNPASTGHPEVYRLDTPAREIQETLDKEIVKGNTLTRFVDGALSGLFSGIMLQPLQVIKTSM
jgi:hypothetical protein